MSVSPTENIPHSSVGKASAFNAGDLGSIPGSGSSPGEGNRNPLQYSCLESPVDRGAYRVCKSFLNWSDLRVAEMD